MSSYKHLIQENAWLRQKLAELQETPGIPALLSYLDKSHLKTIRLARQQEDWNIKNAKGVIPSKDYIHKLNKLGTGRKRAVVSIANQHAEDAVKDWKDKNGQWESQSMDLDQQKEKLAELKKRMGKS